MFMAFVTRLELFTMFGSLIYMVIILECVRRQRLKEAYSLMWLFTGLVFLVLSTWHRSLLILSEILGINYPPATLFLLLMVGVFFILIQYSIVLSKRVEQIKNLNQELALLQLRLEKLEDECRKNSRDDGK